jgi:hypothetical protein
MHAETMKLSRTAFSPSFGILGMLIACGGSNGPAVTGSAIVPETPLGATNAQKTTDANIVTQLAAARCERERTCKNVGPGDKYASREVCMDQTRGSLANDLNGYDCPRGIDRDALERCTAAIRIEECNHPLDTLSRMEKCRTAALCMR